MQTVFLQVVNSGSLEVYLISALGVLASVIVFLWKQQQSILEKVKIANDAIVDRLTVDVAELKSELKEERNEKEKLIRDLEPFLKSLNETTKTLITILKNQHG